MSWAKGMGLAIVARCNDKSSSKYISCVSTSKKPTWDCGPWQRLSVLIFSLSLPFLVGYGFQRREIRGCWYHWQGGVEVSLLVSCEGESRKTVSETWGMGRKVLVLCLYCLSAVLTRFTCSLCKGDIKAWHGISFLAPLSHLLYSLDFLDLKYSCEASSFDSSMIPFVEYIGY